VEQTHIVPGLTVHDVGLSVFGETKSLHDRPGSNEPIAAARQKVAHVVINGAEEAQRRGTAAPSVAPPVEPTDEALRNPEVRAAYESSMNAAREAFLSGHDPTYGATHFNMRPRLDRSKWKGSLPISTQSGPYDNSFPNRNAPAHTTWLNTYLTDENGKQRHKKQEGSWQASSDYHRLRVKIFLADSTQTACIAPFRSGSSGQTSKSAKMSGNS